MKKWFIGLVAGTWLFVAGCSSEVTDEVKEASVLVQRDEAEEIDVEVVSPVGEMVISGGAENWVEGTVASNIKNFEPQVKYKLRNQKADLSIEQPNFNGNRIGNIQNEWDLQLSDNIPMALAVSTGAAKSSLDLRGLQLTKLEIDTGVGSLDVDLGGDWKESFRVEIETGVGSTTVILPSEVGVKITYEKGLSKVQINDFIATGDGSYVNEAYDSAEVILEVKADIGVGSVTFLLD